MTPEEQQAQQDMEGCILKGIVLCMVVLLVLAYIMWWSPAAKVMRTWPVITEDDTPACWIEDGQKVAGPLSDANGRPRITC